MIPVDVMTDAADDCFDEMITGDQQWRTDGMAAHMVGNKMEEPERRHTWSEFVVSSALNNGLFENTNLQLTDISEADADYLLDLIVDRLEDKFFKEGDDLLSAYERAMQII